MLSSSKRYVFSWVLMVLFWSFLAGCGAKAIKKESELDTPENHYRRGLKELEKPNLAAATEEFNRARALRPSYPGAYVGLGLVAMEQGSYEEAVRQIKQAKGRDDQFIDGYIAMGRVLTKQRKGDDWLEKALKEYKKALEINPNSDAAYFYQGMSYKEAFKFVDAGSAFARVVAMKRGPFVERANAEWELVQKIQRAAPGTDMGKQIALIDKIDRADLTVLLLEELKLKEVLEKRRPKTFDAGFKAYEQEVQAETGKKPPPDVQNHWAKNWIEEMLTLGVQGLELFPDGSFASDELITKANYAMVIQGVLILISGDASLATRYIGEPSHFPDVRSDYYAYNAIVLCNARGIMKANLQDGSFGPTEYVSGADALLIIRDLQNVLRMEF